MLKRLDFKKLLIIILVMIGGILVNWGAQALFTGFGLKLVLDEWGSVFLSFFASPVAASVAAFASRGLEALTSDSDILFYCAQSVLLTALIYVAKQAGFFDKSIKSLLAIIAIGFICGLYSGFATLVLFNVRNMPETYALLGRLFTDAGMSFAFAYFLSALIVEIANKTLMVGAMFIVRTMIGKDGSENLERALRLSYAVENNTKKKGLLLMTKVTIVIFIAEVIFSGTAIVAVSRLYNGIAIRNSTDKCYGAASSAVEVINGDEIEDYLALKARASADEDYVYTFEDATLLVSYNDSRDRLFAVREAFPDIEYIYLYKIVEDGYIVVMDLDFEFADEDEYAVGTLHDIDPAFEGDMEALLAGEDIAEKVSTTEEYGWLLTVYRPVKNTAGDTVCYVGVDIQMSDIIIDQRLFAYKIGSLFVAISIIIVFAILSIMKRRMIHPINEMSEAADKFMLDTDEGRKMSLGSLEELEIDSNDEIQFLHESLTKMAEDSVDYVETLKAQNKQIKGMQNAIIWDFAELVEARDACTGNHIKATAFYVKEIAEELRREGKFTDILTDEYIARLHQMAPLHDIGKIKVSDIILNKPGRLTPEEFEVMKTHTTEGRKILESFQTFSQAGDFLKEAIEVANYHHERWDGAGYPEKLKGDEIPLSARIMAVADVFDALVSKRSYKEPFGYDKALSIIKEESGTHFDPDVVEAFLVIAEKVYNEMKE